MEGMFQHPLILVTREDVKNVRQMYGLDDEKRINESLNAVEEWCQKQDHLVEASKYLNRNFLERIFVLAKGSVEGTKRQVEKLFTLRGMMPELSLHRTIPEFEKFLQCVNFVPLPKLCPTDQSRINVTQFLNPERSNILTYFRYCFMVAEYRITFDYCICERFIIDLRNVQLVHIISKVNPVVLKKCEILCSEGFGTKIKGIHILNAPPYVDSLVSILKQSLSEKLANRLHVHSTYEDLHKYIPKDILPKDYGGDEQSCSKLAEQWRNTLKTEEAQKIIKLMDKCVSDESRRKSAKVSEESLGIPGSFRKLDVD